MAFLARWLVTALAVAVAVWLVPGVDIVGGVESWVAVALFGLVLPLANMVVKPVLQLVSLPVTVLTLGVFYVVVNAFVLYIAAWAANGMFQIGFEMATFGSAFVAAIVISVVSAIMNSVLAAD